MEMWSTSVAAFPPPDSLVVNGLAIATLIFYAIIGVSEVTGLHLQYSKFWNLDTSTSTSSRDKRSKLPKKRRKIVLSSRAGMLLFYAPAFLAALAFFWLFPGGGLRSLMVESALALHFFKRIIEVLFVHKYSGGTAVLSTIIISSGYLSITCLLLYAQTLTRQLPEPPVDLKLLGFALFLVGIFGNFYHHYLLASLRKDGEKGYKIPSGGLFGLVICPHYLFEILGFVGISLISQTLCGFSIAVGVVFYLSGRSCATRKWYFAKFEDFPTHVKALVPFVY